MNKNKDEDEFDPNKIVVKYKTVDGIIPEEFFHALKETTLLDKYEFKEETKDIVEIQGSIKERVRHKANF